MDDNQVPERIARFLVERITYHERLAATLRDLHRVLVATQPASEAGQPSEVAAEPLESLR